MTQVVQFVLDEAGSLGPLEVVDDAVDKFRGYGVRLQFYYQSLGQLKKCFPNGQDQTLLSNTSQCFFGVNDPTTAEYVSARIGEATIIVESGGTSSGTSWTESYGIQPNSHGGSSNTSRNWQPQARKLLKPEEVMALPRNTAITFTPGLPPIVSRLVSYPRLATLKRPLTWRSRAWDACRTLAVASLLLAASSVVALLLTAFACSLPTG